jgi:hypothetical protein
VILDKQWRILTVGDGDLSFSAALHTHISPKNLCASIYDSEQQLREKYTSHSLDTLMNNNVTVYTSFDVTRIDCWRRLEQHSFDLVIFQFPLVPGFTSKSEFEKQPLSINTLNRRLLRCFIRYASQYALDPKGQMLCYVTSKDVKPYCEWDLESSLNHKLNIKYLGQSQFNIDQFDGYKIRNVDRDKHVKDTSGITYVWSKKSHPQLSSLLILPQYLQHGYCPYCRVGPFLTEKDKDAHMNSKKHKTMAKHQNDWYAYLETQEF